MRDGHYATRDSSRFKRFLILYNAICELGRWEGLGIIILKGVNDTTTNIPAFLCLKINAL